MYNRVTWHTVTALWMAWHVYWFVGALRVRRNERGESQGQRLRTALVLAAGAYLIFAPVVPFRPLNARFLADARAIRALALGIVVAGLAITVWARRHLGQFWSARVSLKEGHQLIKSGPYAWVRHPIYSGIFLAMLGTALFVGEWRGLLGTAVFLVGHWLKARREEVLLAGQFGTAYEDYCQRTGSLLPRLR